MDYRAKKLAKISKTKICSKFLTTERLTVTCNWFLVVPKLSKALKLDSSLD